MDSIKGRRSAKRLGIFILSSIFLSFFIVSSSYADDYYWVGESGLWNDPLNWSLSSDGTGGAGIPTQANNDYAHIISSDEIDRVIDLTGGALVSGIEIKATYPGTITLLVPDGMFSWPDSLSISSNSPSMNIIVNQTGGAVYGDSLYINNTLYNIYGGRLYGELPFIKNSTVNQSGGEVTTNSGSLNIFDTTYNLSGGSIWADGELYIGGTFNQTGGRVGTGDSNTFFSGTYNLSGTGRIEADTFVTSGLFNYTGGTMYAYYFVNNGSVMLSGSGTRVIDGNVINNGTWKTTNTTAQYTGTFTNNGAYNSDPATQYFNDLIIGENGYLVGQSNDYFYINGNFINNSTMNTDWNTMHSNLGFISGEDILHDFYLTGVDYGAAMSGYSNNFSWGELDIAGNILYLYDGNDIEGGALYLREIVGLDISGNLVTNIFGMDCVNIYYMANLPDNYYLGGLNYALSDGGYLIAMHGVPEPSTMLLLGSGLLGLWGFRRKFKK